MKDELNKVYLEIAVIVNQELLNRNQISYSLYSKVNDYLLKKLENGESFESI